MTTDRTFVIGEAGSCHDLDIYKALRLVNLASQVGADAVKFQWVSDAKRLVARRNAPEYFNAYRMIEFNPNWHESLAALAANVGIEYMCTVYIPEDIAVIAPYVNRFKVSSFEASDLEFIRTHYQYKKPIIISQGMASITNGQESDNGESRVDYLHCISAYPTPYDQINLAAIREGYYDGLSDHTLHAWTGGLAVAAGARIIEFHYRLADSSPAGADYVAARDPGMAIEYVKNIRTAELMMGDGVRKIQECEKPMLKYRVKP